MTDLKDIIRKLINRNAEEDWFEYKENWYDPNGIGEYISSIGDGDVYSEPSYDPDNVYRREYGPAGRVLIDNPEDYIELL